MNRAKICWKLRYYYLKYFQKNQQHLWLYPSVRHVGKRKHGNKERVQYLTKTVNPTAGIGDQLASWITGYFYAGLLGLEYAYSPLYPESWNDFLGFGKGEAEAEKLVRNEGYRRVRLPEFEHKNEEEVRFIQKIIDSYHGEKVLFYIENSHVYGEQYEVKEMLKRKYNMAAARRHEKLIYTEDCLSIAIHIRRGDITIGQVNQNPELVMRWLDNSYYIKVLNQILDLCGDMGKVGLYLFSQGKEEDFKEFSQFPNMNYCLQMGAQESFAHMVRADILLTSKSSFSYKPALLSDGMKVCPKHFWHGYPEQEDWILVDEMSGKIEEQDAQKLVTYMRRKRTDEV